MNEETTVPLADTGRLLTFALNNLGNPSEEDFTPCCATCCMPCHAIMAMLDAETIDTVFIAGNLASHNTPAGWTYWNTSEGRLDRAWITQRITRTCHKCTNPTP